MQIKNSEEDIKLKIVMPYLKSLGFDESELTFEKSYKLNLPRGSVKVDTDKQIETTHPRLDILVTRNGENLFIVEVKCDSNPLADEDKQQAIIYARLVNPMAPLAIVTNGKEFKIYKVGDGEEIEEEKTTILGYKIKEDFERLYQEAFENFISYSKENVMLFSKTQIAEGMKTLIGSKADPYKKFIPDLYVPSKKLEEVIREFLISDKPVFALLGESGAGKTCAMCGLAVDVSKEHPVLFYKAQDLTENLIKSIANDFNWEFSAQSEPITLFKRLKTLFRNKNIIIFVDGVDEWMNHQKIEILGEFASWIKNKNFKLVISCKSGQWKNFLRKSGTPTSLSQEVFSNEADSKGYPLTSFDDDEFYQLRKRYTEFYGFKGSFEEDVLKECRRLPFLFRIFFEVAQKTGHTHLTFSIKEFYDEYYEVVVQRLPGNNVNTNGVLRAAAKLICSRNEDLIDEDLLRKELNLNASEIIPFSFFECNILERTPDRFEPKIGFYFKKFRDYLIAFSVKRWDKISLVEFQREGVTLDFESVTGDAAALFYQLTADVEKKKVIDGALRVNAEAYLDFYIKVLNEHFSSIKQRFSPYTEGSIGFMGLLDIKNKQLIAWGFNLLEEGAERMKFIPVEGGFWGRKLNFKGAQNLHYCGSSNGFKKIEVKKEVLENEIVSQLNRIVKEGRLNESNNYYLSLEKLLGIVVEHQSTFHGIKSKTKLSQHLPIPLDEIEFAVKFDKAKDYFFDKLIEEKIRQGIIKPIKEGSTISYSFSMSKEDQETIEKRAKICANDTHSINEIRYRNIDKVKMEEVLLDGVKAIRDRKRIIDETLLPDEDAVPIGSRAFPHNFYKKETLSHCVHRLYTLFLEEYKLLIETNFPSVKNDFRLYSKMPVHYFLTIKPIADDDFEVRRFICSNRHSAKNEVTLCSNEDIAYDLRNDTFKLRGQDYPLLELSGTGVSSLFSPGEKFINTKIPTEFTRLRGMVYGKIKEELPLVLERLSAIAI